MKIMSFNRYFESKNEDNIISEIHDKLIQFINSIKPVDDERLRTWRGMSVGDKKYVSNIYSDLPSSQADPPNGTYTLSIINIKKTDHYLMGVVDRRFFDQDDYDNWQTEQLEMIKSEFDTYKREPVIAIEGIDGLYSIIDGHHRIVIADELGRESILALVIKNNSQEKLTSQASLNDISAMYISAKKGLLKWDKNRINNFVNWIESLTK